MGRIFRSFDYKGSKFFKLVELPLIQRSRVIGYWNEFKEHGENENVLWELDDCDIVTYYVKQEEDERNIRYGFFVDGKLCGMLRISSRINHEASGMLGYSIRPSMRGNGYAQEMIKMAIGVCKMEGIIPVTACVDIRNMTSRWILQKCGFKATGRLFEWIPNPNPRTALEYKYN